MTCKINRGHLHLGLLKFLFGPLYSRFKSGEEQANMYGENQDINLGDRDWLHRLRVAQICKRFLWIYSNKVTPFYCIRVNHKNKFMKIRAYCGTPKYARICMNFFCGSL